MKTELKSGFSLVELMIAVMLMALLTSAVALSFSGSLRTARATDAIEQLRGFDASNRMFAKRFSEKVTEELDLSANTLARRESVPVDRISARASLPTGMWIDEVRVGGRLSSGGELAAVEISPMGLSESYAVRLRGPDTDRWMVFAGLTGAMTDVQDESTVATLLAGGTRGAK